MTVQQQIAQLYQRIDKSVGGILPGGYKAPTVTPTQIPYNESAPSMIMAVDKDTGEIAKELRDKGLVINTQTRNLQDNRYVLNNGKWYDFGNTRNISPVGTIAPDYVQKVGNTPFGSITGYATMPSSQVVKGQVQQQIAQLYQRIDKSVGGILPGGYKAPTAPTYVKTVTPLEPYVYKPVKAPDTTAIKEYDKVYQSLPADQKLIADVEKQSFDAQANKIQTYAQTHAPELYRAFSGDYTSKEVQVPVASALQQGILQYTTMKQPVDTAMPYKDQQVVVELEKQFKSLGPQGEVAWAEFRTDLKSQIDRNVANEATLQRNIATLSKVETPTPTQNVKEYYKGIVKDIRETTLPELVGVAKYGDFKFLTPKLALVSKPVEWIGRAALTPLVGSNPFSAVDYSLSPETITKVYGGGRNLATSGKMLVNAPAMFFEKEFVSGQVQKSLGGYEKLVGKYEQAGKDLEAGKITTDEYRNIRFDIETNPDWVNYNKYGSYTSRIQDIASSKASGFEKAGVNVFAGLGQASPWLIPGVSTAMSAEMIGQGAKSFNEGKYLSGVVQLGVSALPFVSKLGAAKPTTFIKSATPVSELTLWGTMKPTLGKVGFGVLGGGMAVSSAYSTYKSTLDIPSALGRGLGTAGAFFGPPAYKAAKTYVSKQNIYILPTESAEFTKEQLNRYAQISNKEYGKDVTIFKQTLDNGREYIEAPFKGSAKTAFMRVPGTQTLSIPKWKEDVSSFLYKDTRKRIDWVPRPTSPGAPGEFSYGLNPSGKMKTFDFTKSQFEKGRAKTIKFLTSQGYTPNVARSIVARKAPQLKEVEMQFEPLSIQRLGGDSELFVRTSGTQKVIPLKRTVYESGNVGRIKYEFNTKTGGQQRTYKVSEGMFRKSILQGGDIKSASDNVLNKEFYSGIKTVTPISKSGRLGTPQKYAQQYLITPKMVSTERYKISLQTTPSGTLKVSKIPNDAGKLTRSNVLVEQISMTSKLGKSGKPSGNMIVQTSRSLIKSREFPEKLLVETKMFPKSPQEVFRLNPTADDYSLVSMTGVERRGYKLIGMRNVPYSRMSEIKGSTPNIKVSKVTRFGPTQTETFKVSMEGKNLLIGGGKYKSFEDFALRKPIPEVLRISGTIKTTDTKGLSNPFADTKISVEGEFMKAGRTTKSGRPPTPYYTLPEAPLPPKTKTEEIFQVAKVVPSTSPVITIAKTTTQSVGAFAGLGTYERTSDIGSSLFFPLSKSSARITTTPGVIVSPMSMNVQVPTLSVTPTLVPKEDIRQEPRIVPDIIPRTSTTPTLTPSLTPSLVPSLTPALVPKLTPSLVPTLVPKLTPSMVLTPNLVPKQTLRPTPFIPFILPTKKGKKIVAKKKPFAKGYYVLTRKQKRPVLITPRPLTKGQALGFGVAATSKTARATFQLIPTTNVPVKSRIKPLNELQVFRMGYRPPVKKGRVQPTNLIFIQKRTTRMNVRSEYKDIQSFKRGNSIW